MSNAVLNSFLRSRCSFNVCREMFCRTKFAGSQTSVRSYAKRKVPKHHKMPLFETSQFELAPKVAEKPKQKFDYFLILDFEATCDSPVNLDPQEIIEFPVLKVNGDTLKVESSFHSYVRPVINPELSSFCTELTGIIQSMVDNEPPFEVVFEKFLSWLEKEELLKSGTKFAFVTCGDPDLDYLLPVQCRIFDIHVPAFMKQWINIKRSFCNIKPYTWPNNLSKMLEYCNLKPYGELHSGLDDATNIARVLADLAERGLVYDFNGWKDT